MTGHDPEIEELREKVHCAVVLERTPPPWELDRKESTKLSLKYRRGKGEILIVSHAGRGWWDPTSDAKGDVFGLVQRLEPTLSFGLVRKRLREYAGLSPRFPPADRAGCRNSPDRPVAERWAERKAVWPNSPTWQYLARTRRLPFAIIEAASAVGVVRDGAGRQRLVSPSRRPRHCRPCRCARTELQRFADRRSQIALPAAPEGSAPSEAGSRRGGDRCAERRGDREPAQGHALRRDRRGHGPGHDRRARGAARRYRNAPRRASLQRRGRQRIGGPLCGPAPIPGGTIRVPFTRLRPPIEGGDWNDVLGARSERRRAKPSPCSSSTPSCS